MMRKGLGKGKGKGYKNMMGKDPKVHSQSARGRKQPQKIPMMKDLSQRQISNRNYENYLINSINTEGYDLKEEPKTVKAKLQFVKDTFRDEYWNNNQPAQMKGEVTAFADYLSGLPSTVDIPFYNNEILELAKKMGSLPENATEKQEDRVLENYWNFMSNKMFQLFRKYGVR